MEDILKLTEPYMSKPVFHKHQCSNFNLFLFLPIEMAGVMQLLGMAEVMLLLEMPGVMQLLEMAGVMQLLEK